MIECRSWAEVSLGAISRNYQRIRAAVGPEVETAAVVKSEAYGHGAIQVARALETAGARWLAVSTVEEGSALRHAGLTSRILVMADNLPFTRAGLFEHDLTPAVHTIEEAFELNRLAAGRPDPFPIHLKVDSGMGRLGIRQQVESIIEAVRVCPNLRLEGLMSHLASASDYESGQTDRQLAAFRGICAALTQAGMRPRYTHLSSSAPVVYGRTDVWFSMVRPGLALYGYVSPAARSKPAKIVELEPALTWKASVLAVKSLPEGAPVGYGGLFRAPRPVRIAVIGAGYADGIPHRLSNRGRVVAAGMIVPILGAVSMDLTTIDVTDCPEVRPGGSVTLLGSEGTAAVTAQDIAETAGTISYDVLCGIRPRVTRIYNEAGL